MNESVEMPHGIKYSLTLHDRRNHRVIGYDNAHSFKSLKNMGLKKLRGIIFINRWILLRMNLNQHRLFWKIFGIRLNIIWRIKYEIWSSKSWHHVTGRV